ncbi:MAG: FlgD immunoglobulin-like domain containing protein, partial [Candidatus Cloacimonadota bacterium]|nr:FlgD immunoglobulin-like domain containing protein [Candidatus Cloacimonadota bacterium]
NEDKSVYYKKMNSAPLLRIICPNDSVLFVEMTGSGTSWEGTFTPPELGIFDVRVSASDIDGNTGVDYYQFEYTGVNNDDNEILWNRIVLSNHPNPFNPTTTISFSVTQNSDFVTLEVYNIKGQKVKTLDCSNCFAAASKGLMHSIVWNGTNENNQPVSSGIYFYQLNVNGKTEAVRKMLMLK